MAKYDAIENGLRVRSGLISLLSGRSIDFADTQEIATPVFIVVFDGEASRFSGGRIMLFQQFFLERLGIIPEIIREVPACIKVFFSIHPDDYDAVRTILQTMEFKTLCGDLNVSQVQLGGTMFHVGPAAAP